MDRRALLFAAVLAITGSACSRGNPYSGRINKRFIYSPDLTHAAVVADHTLMQQRWLGAPKPVGKKTTLSMVRGEKPYIQRPATGPNPEIIFLAASCPSSDFSVKWVDNAHLQITVQGCTTANINEKKAQIADVSIDFM